MEVMDHTLKMMEEGEKYITMSKSRNLIALLGLTGSGKTTVSLLLTTDINQLIAVEMGPGSYLITDTNKKISSPKTTLISQTILPDMMIDPTSGAVFYDCPGFKDTRNSSMEIATAFFMKKVLNHAEKIKLIFVVDHNIFSSRTEFPDLLRHATTLIKDVDKFKDGIGIVFTKVHNTYHIVNGIPTLVDDNQTIENTANLLRNVLDSNDGRLDEQMMEFINVTLTKHEDNYTRMNLFRYPDRPGPLSDIPLMQTARSKMIQMIHGNLQYIPSTPADFGYTISDGTEMDIIDMLQNITRDLSQKLTTAIEKIKLHFAKQEREGYNIETLEDKYRTASDRFTNIVGNEKIATEFIELFGSIQKFIQDFNITESEQDSLDVKMLGERLRLIGVVAPKHDINRSVESIIAPVKRIERLFNELKNWFTFLVTLEKEASKFEKLRKPPSKYNEIKEQLAAVERNEIDMTGQNLAEFLDEISTGNKFIFGYDLMKNVVIDDVRARMLNQILESTFITKPTSWCYDSHKLRITALYLKLSEVLSVPGCPEGTKFIEVFVEKKLYIDTDFIKIGQNLNLVMISPTWEVLGERRIQLDGYHAPGYSPANAPDGAPGTEVGQGGQHGANGHPGLPGGNGGNFFGIAHEILNVEKLTITVNGGNGGIGQHAGNGGTGGVGQRASSVSGGSHGYQIGRGHPDYIDHDTFKKDGAPGGSGGHGGRGGAGGLGGLSGKIRLLVSTSPANFKRSEGHGAIAAHGNRGLGGFNGMWGMDCYGTRERWRKLGVRKTFWHDKGCRQDNRKTVQRNEIDNTALNYDNLQQPSPQVNPDFGYVLNDYKKYVRESGPLTPYVKIPTTLMDLPNDYTTRNRRDTGAIISTGFNHALYPSIHLLDLIVRKCTKVKMDNFYNATNNDETFVDPMTVTDGFERLLAELRANGEINNNCHDFDPMSIIQQLKPLMLENRYEDVHQVLFDRVKSYGLSSEIAPEYYVERIDRLLRE